MKTARKVLTVCLHDSLAGVGYGFSTPSYSVSGLLAADLTALCGTLDDQERDLVGASALLVLAGLFVPDVIEVQWPSCAARSESFRELLRILYDIRSYCGQTGFHFPEIRGLGDGLARRRVVRSGAAAGNASEVLQLLSGGIDSTRSLLRLMESGSTPTALHLGLNIDTNDLELRAAKRISKQLGISLLLCPFVMEGLPSQGADANRWPQFGQFPYYNSIPHGRDILSAAVASIVATRRGIRRIAFGQEQESRQKVLLYRGRRILRHDVESNEGAAILNSWINQHLSQTVNVFSPIGDETIKAIRLHMADAYPEILSITQSCVWERLCGKCLKCISLYVLQRLLGKEFFHFQENPLAAPANEDLAHLVDCDCSDNEVGYGQQIRNDIRSIIASGNYTAEDYWIIRATQRQRFH